MNESKAVCITDDGYPITIDEALSRLREARRLIGSIAKAHIKPADEALLESEQALRRAIKALSDKIKNRSVVMAAEPTCTEHAYCHLLSALRDAHNADDGDKRERIYNAILVFEELWPEDCKRWNDRWTNPPGHRVTKT